MRSTSSRRSAVALLLCGTLLWRSAPTVAGAEAGASTEPALLLKYAAPDLPDRSAREVLDPIPAIVAKELRIRWLPVPMEPSGKASVRRGDPGSRRRGPATDRRERCPAPPNGWRGSRAPPRNVFSRRPRRSAGRTGSRRRRARSSRRSFSGGGSSVSGRGRHPTPRRSFPACGRCVRASPRTPPCFPPRCCPHGKRSGTAPCPKRNSWSSRSPPARRSSSTESVGESPRPAFERKISRRSGSASPTRDTGMPKRRVNGFRGTRRYCASPFPAIGWLASANFLPAPRGEKAEARAPWSRNSPRRRGPRGWRS